eukprot:10114379-Ditylum_brightwellii.AAC.1
MGSMSEYRSSNGSQVRRQRRSTLLNLTGIIIVLAAAAASSSIPCVFAYIALPLHKIMELSTAAMDMSVDDNHSVSMMPKVTNRNGNSMVNAIEQKLEQEAANKK